MELHIYESKERVAINFARYLEQFMAASETVHLALSGGSTPKLVFEILAKDYEDKINWSKVHLYWGDERCVPPTHEDSNYKMTVDHLLSKIRIPAENIHRIRGEDTPSGEAVRYAKVISERVPFKNLVPHFDLVILGLGDDGHTASIFPHQMHLWDSENLCELAKHPDSGQQRITITGRLINNAKKVAFLVNGASKAVKVREILKKEGNYEAYPASRVQPHSGHLSWFLDKHAFGAVI